MAKDATSDLLDEYCKENPEMLTRTLARMIYSKHSDLFKDVEDIRTKVRYRRGNRGPKSRKDPKYPKPNGTVGDAMAQFRLPSHQEKRKPYVIPKSIKKTLLISDIHIPYHDTEALEAALEYGVAAKVDSIIINGDLIDMYKASSFTKDPTKVNLKYELEMTQEFFDLLRHLFPTQQIYFKLGNHEARWETYLKSKAPELFGDEYYRLEERLGLVEWKVHFIDSLELIKYGKLNIVHGHEFGRSFFNPVNPARGLFLRAKASTIAGHNHQTSEHHENNLNGDSIACWSTGCLCELEPEYRPFAYTKWNHGFAILEKSKDGSFKVHNHRIIDGKVR